MCQELHDGYSCNPKHTVLVNPLLKCGRPWVPGIIHHKIKVIRQRFNHSCPKCSWRRIYVPARATPPTHTVAPAASIVYTPAPAPASVLVVPRPAPTLLVPTPQPAQIIIPPPLPPPVPTFAQQTPGPGSGGAPLAVPKGTVLEYRLEYMKSKGCHEWVAHYKKDPAAPATNPNHTSQQGYNTIHGADPGPPPPGWGVQLNPFPANRTGYNTTHGADPGPPPPGMGGLALVPMPTPVPVASSAAIPAPQYVPPKTSPPSPHPQSQPQSSAGPQVHFATLVSTTAGATADGLTSSLGDLTETSTDTSASDTETSTTGSSTSTATIQTRDGGKE